LLSQIKPCHSTPLVHFFTLSMPPTHPGSHLPLPCLIVPNVILTFFHETKSRHPQTKMPHPDLEFCHGHLPSELW
jgi:hypothetical protein